MDGSGDRRAASTSASVDDDAADCVVDPAREGARGRAAAASADPRRAVRDTGRSARRSCGSPSRCATASTRFRALQDVLANEPPRFSGVARRRSDPDDGPRGAAPAGARARREHARRPGAAGHGQDVARSAPDRRPDRARQARRRDGDEPQGDRQPAGGGRARRGRGRRRRSSGARKATARGRACPSSWRIENRRRPRRRCFDPSTSLVAGTSWLFAPELADEQLDYLVIDEAGQLSLADALAAGTCRAQPDPARRPAAAAARLAGDAPRGHEPQRARSTCSATHATDPAERGLFLDRRRWRMHPDVCAFISRRGLRGPPGVAPGLRAPERRRRGRHPLPARRAHAATRRRRRRRPSAIRARDRAPARRDRYRDMQGRRAAARRRDDCMVVTPYNAQVRAARGRRCPTAFASAPSTASRDRRRRSSSSRWRPRAARTRRATSRFLFSRNRLNVAISRARCLAYLVCAPALLETHAQDARADAADLDALRALRRRAARVEAAA